MPIKIIATGNPYLTRIVDTETGEDLTSRLRVTNLSWVNHGDSGHSEATFTCCSVPLETTEGYVIEETTKRVVFTAGSIEQESEHA